MKLNFKNLTRNEKRIRIKPLAGLPISANIGVDNPTTGILEDGSFVCCLSARGDCDGAVNGCTVTFFNSGGLYTITKNGNEVTTTLGRNIFYSSSNALEYGFECIPLDGNGNVIPEDPQGLYNGANSALFRNRSLSSTDKFVIEALDANPVAHTLDIMNPTVYAPSPFRLEFCLSPTDISCAGARVHAEIANFDGQWKMIVDGVMEPTPSDDITTWLGYFSENPRISYEIVDGVHVFGNRTERNKRVRLVYLSGSTPTVPEQGNETVNVDESNNDVTFCLVPIA